MNQTFSAADVAAEVAKLTDFAGDPEAAHGREDAIWLAVLEAIARGSLAGDEAARACQEAIESVRVDFPRWCA